MSISTIEVENEKGTEEERSQEWGNDSIVSEAYAMTQLY